MTVLNNNRRSGSQSDPSPMVQESAEYLKRKAGRHNRLQKLTKYTQKKPDRTSGASINSAWLKAFEKAEAQSKESGGDILDALSSEFTHQKTIAPRKFVTWLCLLRWSYNDFATNGFSEDFDRMALRSLLRCQSSIQAKDMA